MNLKLILSFGAGISKCSTHRSPGGHLLVKHASQAADVHSVLFSMSLQLDMGPDVLRHCTASGWTGNVCGVAGSTCYAPVVLPPPSACANH